MNFGKRCVLFRPNVVAQLPQRKSLVTSMKQQKPNGLVYKQNYLSPAMQNLLVEDAVKILDRIRIDSKQRDAVQGRTYLSKQHNLKTPESYRVVSILSGKNDQDKISAQYFDKYGEDGHELTYFIGNENLPKFVVDNLVNPMKSLIETEQLGHATGAETKEWKFTLNAYSTTAANASTIAGFPFHIDVPSNGVITSICTLVTPATLEFRKKDDPTTTYSVYLEPGSLALLSNESRYQWEHRVVPDQVDFQKLPPSARDRNIGRISLVLGCM